MKKKVGILLTVSIMCTALAGCGNDAESSVTLNIPEINMPASTGASSDGDGVGGGVTGKGGKSGSLGSSEDTNNDADGGETDGGYAAYLSIQQIQTELGIVQIPVLNTEKLKGQDATLASAMFQNLETSILQNVDEVLSDYEQNGVQYGSERKNELLCETEVSLNDDVLSVLAYYQELSSTSSPAWYYEGVNLDVRTGKVVPSMELITKAGYSEELMTDSVTGFSDIYEYYYNETIYYNRLGNLRYLPNPYEGLPTDVQLDSMMAVRSVTDKPEPQGKSWDALDRFPLVFYKGEGQVAVVAMLETPAGAGFQWTKIWLAKSPEGVFVKNHIPTRDFEYWHLPKSEEEALFAVHDLLELDEDRKTPEGVKLGFDTLYVENLWDNNHNFDPYYVVKAIEELETHMATYGFYAVSVFDERMMELDEATDEWRPIMKGTPVIDSTFLHEDEAACAVAAVSYNLNPYELWSLNLYQYIDVVVYSRSEEEVLDEEVRGLFIWPRDDDTSITLISGEYNDRGVFEEMSYISTLDAESGLGTYLRFIRWQEECFAIRIENSNGSALHVLGDMVPNEQYGDLFQYLYQE